MSKDPGLETVEVEEVERSCFANDWAEEGKVILLMRHGEKEKADNKTDIERLLTENGRRAAEENGTKLLEMFGDKLVRKILHSPVPRCGETAKAIANGMGLPEEHIVSYELLEGVPCFFNSRKQRNIIVEGIIAKEGRNYMFDRMVRGDYAEYDIPETEEGVRQFFRTLEGTCEKGVNICVAHDWIIFLLSRFVGLRDSDFYEDRPKFLEEMLIRRKGENAEVFFRGQSREWQVW